MALSLAAAWRELQTTRILTFRNLISGPDKERYDALAASFADLLELEIRRINRLRTEDVAFERGGLFDPALERGQTPKLRARGTFQGLRTASGTGSGGTSSEIDTVAVGPLRFSPAAALGAVLRPSSRTIFGSFVPDGGGLKIIAEFTGRPRRKWEIPSNDDADEPTTLPILGSLPENSVTEWSGSPKDPASRLTGAASHN